MAIITKAILTGGGRATRLWPVTTTTNKHLLPLANKPMIVHAIEKVAAAGITDIFINTNPGDAVLPAFIGDGSQFGVCITYFEQTGGPLGIAHVVNEAHRFIGDSPFLFYLSDNILLGDIRPMLDEFDRENYDCLLALAKVEDARAFGVPVFDESGALKEVLEKPENPPNQFAVTGIYLYGPKLFFDAFATLSKSARGEYEISDIHTKFLKEGKRVGYKEISGYWKDTGKPEDLLTANRLLLEGMADEEFASGLSHPAAGVHNGAQNTGEDNAVISGNVSIGKDAHIGINVELRGPVIIGDGCVLEQCTIGPYTTIGNESTVRGAHIEDSIVLDHAHIEGGLHLAHSLVGRSVSITSKESSRRPHKMIVGDKTVIEVDAPV